MDCATHRRAVLFLDLTYDSLGFNFFFWWTRLHDLPFLGLKALRSRANNGV